MGMLGNGEGFNVDSNAVSEDNSAQNFQFPKRTTHYLAVLKPCIYARLRQLSVIASMVCDKSRKICRMERLRVLKTDGSADCNESS